MQPAFSAEAIPLERFLSGPEVFTIPPFQRPYTWGVREASKLLDDVLACLGSDLDTAPDVTATVAPLPPDTPSHFLGAIVLMQSEEGRLDIIDGQQRLITMTILLAVLRDLAAEAGEAAEAEALHALIEAPPAAPACYRLRLRDDAETFFHDFVQGRGATLTRRGGQQFTDCQTRVLDNRAYFRRELKELRSHERHALARIVCNQCWLVRVLASDVDSAYEIFEVLNFAGKPLSRADILKAKLTGALDTKSDCGKKAMAHWQRLQNQLGDKGFDRLLGHLRTIHGRGETTIVKENLVIIDRCGGPTNYLEDIVVPYGDAFLALRGMLGENANAANGQIPIGDGTNGHGIGTYGHGIGNDRIDGDGKGNGSLDHVEHARRAWEAIRPHVVYLGWLRHREWVPPALAWLVRNGIGHPQTKSFFAALERLSYGLMFLGRGRNRRLVRFGQVLRSIMNGGNEDTLVGELTDDANPLALSLSEQANILYNVSRDLHARNKSACRLLLFRLDDVLSGRLTLRPSSDITVEHICPRRPSKNGYWAKCFPTPQMRQRASQRLSNLLLVESRRHRQLQRKSFAEKQKIIAANGGARFALSDYFLAAEKWTLEELDVREDELMSHIKAIWQLEGPAGRELDR